MAPKSLASAPARLSFKGRNGEADLEVACAWGSFSNQGNGAAPSASTAGGGVGGPAPAAKLPVDAGQPYGRGNHGGISSGYGRAAAPLGGDTSDEAESVGEEDGAAVSFLGPGATAEPRGGKAPLVRFSTNSITGRLPGVVTLPSTAAASAARAGQQHHQQHQYRPHSRAAAEVRSKRVGVESEEEDDHDEGDAPGPSGQAGGPRSSWSRHGVQKKPILKSKAATEGGGLAQAARPRRPVLFQDPGEAAGSPGSLSAPAKHLSYRHLEEDDDDDEEDEGELEEGVRANAGSRASDSAAAARQPGGASASGATMQRHRDGVDRASSLAVANGRPRGPRGTLRFQPDGAGRGHGSDSDESAGGGGEGQRLGAGRAAGRDGSCTSGQGKKASRPATGYRYHAAPDSPRQQHEQGHGHHAGHITGGAHNHNHAHGHGHGHGGAAADATWGHVTRSAAPKPVLRLRQGSYTSMGSVHSFVGSPGSLAAAARPAAHRSGGGGGAAAEASADSASTPGLWDTDSEPASESELIVEGPQERVSLSGLSHHTIGGRSSGSGAGAGLAAPVPVFRRSSHNGGGLAAAAPAPVSGAGPGGVGAPTVPAGAAGRGALHTSMGEWKQGVRQWKHGAGYDAQQLQPLPPPVPKPILQNRRSAPGTVGGGGGADGSSGGGGTGGSGGVYQHSRLQQQRAQRKLRFEVPEGGAPPGAADDEDAGMDPRVAAAAAARSKAGARVATPAANAAAKTGWRGAWRRITAALGRRPSTPAPKDLMRRAAEKAAAAGAAGGREPDGEEGEGEEQQEEQQQERVEVRPAAGAARRPPTGKPAGKRGTGRSVGFAVPDGEDDDGGRGVGGLGGAGRDSGEGDADEGDSVEPTEKSAIVRRPRAMDSRVAHRKRMAHNVGRQPSLYVAADRAIRFQIPDSSGDSEEDEEDGHDSEAGGGEEGAWRVGGVGVAGAGRGGLGQRFAGAAADEDEQEDEGGDVVAAVGLRERGGQEGWRRQSASGQAVGLAAEGAGGSPRGARLSSGAGGAPSSRGSKRNSHSSSGAGLCGDEGDAGPLAAATSPRSPGSLLVAGVSGGMGIQTSPSGAAAAEAGGSSRPRVAFSLRGGGSNAVAPSPPGTREQSPAGSHGGAGPSSSSAAASPMQHASPVPGGGGGGGPRRTVTLGTMNSAGSALPALSSPAPPPGPPPAPPPGEPMGPRLLRRNLTNASEVSRRDGPSPSVSMNGAAPPSAPPSQHVSISGSGFGSGAGAAAAAAAVAAAAATAAPASPLAANPSLHLHPASSVSSNASSAHGAHPSPHHPSATTPGRTQHGPTSRLFAETSASALPGGGRHGDQQSQHSLSRSLPHSRSMGAGASSGGGHEPQPGSPGGSGSFVGSDAGENSGRWRTVFNKIKSAMSGGGGSSRDSSPGRGGGGSPAGSGRNTPRRGSVASMSDSGRVAAAVGDALGGDGGAGGGDASEPPTPTAAARHRAMDSRISHRKRMALERKPSLVMAATRVLAEGAEEEEAAAAAAAAASGGAPGSGGGEGSRDRVVRFEELVAHRQSAPGTLCASAGGERWSADGRDGSASGAGGGSEAGTAAYAAQQQYRHSTGAVPAGTSGRSSGGGGGTSTSGGGAAPAPPPSDERRSSRGGFLTRLRESLSGRN